MIIENHKKIKFSNNFKNKHKSFFNFIDKNNYDIVISDDLVDLENVIKSLSKEEYPFDFDGFFSLEFCNPFLSKSTELLFSVINFQSDTNRIYKAGGATHSVTSPYDGFTFYPSGGTISGTMRIYGYRN